MTDKAMKRVCKNVHSVCTLCKCIHVVIVVSLLTLKSNYLADKMEGRGLKFVQVLLHACQF